MAEIPMELIESLKQIAEANPDGFTVRLPELEFVTSGWVVAMKETQNCFGDQGLEKALTIAQQTSNIFGGWKEGSRWYWDASYIFTDETEATEAGVENGQIAIFNLDTLELKFL